MNISGGRVCWSAFRAALGRPPLPSANRSSATAYVRPLFMSLFLPPCRFGRRSPPRPGENGGSFVFLLQASLTNDYEAHGDMILPALPRAPKWLLLES